MKERKGHQSQFCHLHHLAPGQSVQLSVRAETHARPPGGHLHPPPGQPSPRCWAHQGELGSPMRGGPKARPPFPGLGSRATNAWSQEVEEACAALPVLPLPGRGFGACCTSSLRLCTRKRSEVWGHRLLSLGVLCLGAPHTPERSHMPPLPQPTSWGWRHPALLLPPRLGSWLSRNRSGDLPTVQATVMPAAVSIWGHSHLAEGRHGIGPRFSE